MSIGFVSVGYRALEQNLLLSFLGRQGAAPRWGMQHWGGLSGKSLICVILRGVTESDLLVGENYDRCLQQTFVLCKLLLSVKKAILHFGVCSQSCENEQC